MKIDPKTGLALELYGGRLLPQSAPASEGEYRSQAEQYLAAARDLFGLSPEQQSFVEFAHLPLAKIGSSDKITVNFAQSVAEIPVEGAYANVFMGADGRLLSIVSWIAPDAGGLQLEPALDAAGARFLCQEYVRNETELTPVAFSDGLGDYDLAELRLLVGGVEQAFWKNHERIPLVDTPSHPGSWVPVEYELTNTLIGHANFQVRWCMDSNQPQTDRLELGGWAIDDVEILRIGALP